MLGLLAVVLGARRNVESGALLPEQFWQDNEHKVRGGVEFAFMSMTRDRAVALEYASSQGAVGLVFEVQQGLIDRGADVSWLSQYPHEKEILFNPLTGIEALRSRIDGSVVVDEVSQKAANTGYDANARKYGDMLKAGIIDPVKVVRTALSNAASIAGLLLTTEALVTTFDKDDKDKQRVEGSVQ